MECYNHTKYELRFRVEWMGGHGPTVPVAIYVSEPEEAVLRRPAPAAPGCGVTVPDCPVCGDTGTLRGEVPVDGKGRFAFKVSCNNASCREATEWWLGVLDACQAWADGQVRKEG